MTNAKLKIVKPIKQICLNVVFVMQMCQAKITIQDIN